MSKWGFTYKNGDNIRTLYTEYVYIAEYKQYMYLDIRTIYVFRYTYILRKKTYMHGMCDIVQTQPGRNVAPDAPPPAGRPPVVRIKTPEEGCTTWKDTFLGLGGCRKMLGETMKNGGLSIKMGV